MIFRAGSHVRLGTRQFSCDILVTIPRRPASLHTMKTRKPSSPHESQPAPGRYFHLTYSSAGPDDVHKLFQGRDGTAFDELAATLPPLGYRFGTTIHFYPNDKRPLKDFPELRANDLLVLTTRPPLTDREALSPPRRIVLSSENVKKDPFLAGIMKVLAEIADAKLNQRINDDKKAKEGMKKG